MRDWDDAFNNMGHVEESDALPGFWAARAAAYRSDAARIEVDIPFGPSEREKFDLVWPDVEPKGLVAFVHGGFWMRPDKSYWTDIAEGTRTRGPGSSMSAPFRQCPFDQVAETSSMASAMPILNAAHPS